MVSAEESIPSETPISLYGRSVLFQQFNEVDFYVEDLDQAHFYHQILGKLFPNIEFENIHPLGGKQNLLARAAEQINEQRKAVYIVDKDFDDLLGLVKTFKNVFYLERFCIENYLLEEKAFVEFVIAEQPKVTKRTIIAKELALKSEVRRAAQSLKKLFSLFYIVQKNSLMNYIKNTGNHPRVFFKKDIGAFDPEAIEKYANKVASLFKSKKLESKLSDEITACVHLFDEGDETVPNISGEFILFCLLNMIIRRFKFETEIPFDSFRYKLAQQCNFDSLVGLKVQVELFLASK